VQARAAAANRLLGAGLRLSVRPWFSVGYLLADRVGKSTHVTELDSLWTTARGWGATLPGWVVGSGDAVVYPDLPVRCDLDAVAVWLPAVAHLARPDTLEMTLPDPAGDRTVVAQVVPGAVTVTVAPPGPVAMILSGGRAAPAAASRGDAGPGRVGGFRVATRVAHRPLPLGRAFRCARPPGPPGHPR
jgi:hypothetical protein